MSTIFRHVVGTAMFFWSVQCLAGMKGLKGREKITYIYEFFCRILISSVLSQLFR